MTVRALRPAPIGRRPITLLPILSLFLLVVALVPEASAQFVPQPAGFRVVRMPYTNTGGENGVSIFHYRRDGALDRGLWQLTDHSRHSANYYRVDAAGFVVRKYREFSDGLTSTETYENDAAGRRLREIWSRSDGKHGQAVFTWDDAGHLVAADCDTFRGWLTAHIAYTYADGRLDSAEISRDGQVIGHIAYVYEPSGRLASETWDFGGRWSQTFSYEYEPIPERVFSAATPWQMANIRYRVAAEDYDYNGQGGGPSHYTYDAAGRLTRKVFERSDGLRTETTYVFDDRGNLVSSHRAYHDGRTADFTYTYDSALRLTGRSCRRSDGQTGAETYVYDDWGRLTGAVYRNMDFWLDGDLTFSHDPWGRLVTGRFAGRDGFDAGVNFVCDDDGNVVAVHWMFDQGATQTYRFEYEPVPQMHHE